MISVRRCLLLLAALGLVSITVACGRVRDRGATPVPAPPNPAETVPLGTSAPQARTTDLRPGVDAIGDVRTTTLTTADGRTRSYRVYVPTTLADDGRPPVLIGLHGGMGWGEQFELNSGFDRLAEANGVLAVYPDGIGAGPNADKVGGSALRTWNGGDCCGPAARDKVDDVAFISSLIDQLESDYRIDPDRVFLTGHSNGAIMSYRVACELADRVAAVAVYAGSLEVSDCAPSSPVSLMHVHGTDDQNIPIGGGAGPEGISGESFTPPLTGVQRFAGSVGCHGDGVKSRSASNPDVESTLWSPCTAGVEVQFVTVDGATHAWSGSAPSARVGTPYAGYDASAELLAFLLSHPKVH